MIEVTKKMQEAFLATAKYKYVEFFETIKILRLKKAVQAAISASDQIQGLIALAQEIANMRDDECHVTHEAHQARRERARKLIDILNEKK